MDFLQIGIKNIFEVSVSVADQIFKEVVPEWILMFEAFLQNKLGPAGVWETNGTPACSFIVQLY